jgi:uncharacterized protein YjbJ (UPF0337 family)
MDKDRIKGSFEDAKGRAKRQVGEWTGDNKLQGEGLADQAKGKVQNAFGNVKDKARDIADDVDREAGEPSRDSGDRFFDKTKRSA